jgi:hypothetical protein
LSALYLWENETTIFHQKFLRFFFCKKAHSSYLVRAHTGTEQKLKQKHYTLYLSPHTSARAHTLFLSLLSLTHTQKRQFVFLPFQISLHIKSHFALFFTTTKREEKETEAKTLRTNEEREKKEERLCHTQASISIVAMTLGKQTSHSE